MEECDFVTEINGLIMYKYINRIHKMLRDELLRKREHFPKGVAFSGRSGIMLALIKQEC